MTETQRAQRKVKPDGERYQVVKKHKLAVSEFELGIGFELHECFDGWYQVVDKDNLWYRLSPRIIQSLFSNNKISKIN